MNKKLLNNHCGTCGDTERAFFLCLSCIQTKRWKPSGLGISPHWDSIVWWWRCEREGGVHHLYVGSLWVVSIRSVAKVGKWHVGVCITYHMRCYRASGVFLDIKGAQTGLSWEHPNVFEAGPLTRACLRSRFHFIQWGIHNLITLLSHRTVTYASISSSLIMLIKCRSSSPPPLSRI